MPATYPIACAKENRIIGKIPKKQRVGDAAVDRVRKHKVSHNMWNECRVELLILLDGDLNTLRKDDT